jgi:hypothetical protein
MRAVMTGLALRSRVFRQVAALLCLTLFVGLHIVSASATLHETLHADAANAEHHCVVSILADGQVQVPALVSAHILPVLGFVCFLPVLRMAPSRCFDCRLAPTRGPPCS